MIHLDQIQGPQVLEGRRSHRAKLSVGALAAEPELGSAFRVDLEHALLHCALMGRLNVELVTALLDIPHQIRHARPFLLKIKVLDGALDKRLSLFIDETGPFGTTPSLGRQERGNLGPAPVTSEQPIDIAAT
jgi:hypothetical protein